MLRKVTFAGGVVVLAILAVAPAAFATNPHDDEHRITICHATPPDTAAEGWHSIEVDVASVGYQNSGHQSEHDADIIPPYSYGDFSYPGKGDQAILANGCAAIVVVEPTCQTDPSLCPVEPPSEPPVVPETPVVPPVAPVPPTVVVGEPTAPVVAPPGDVPLNATPTGELAYTGTAANIVALIGGLLLGTGLVLLWRSRQRRTVEPAHHLSQR